MFKFNFGAEFDIWKSLIITDLQSWQNVTDQQSGDIPSPRIYAGEMKSLTLIILKHLQSLIDMVTSMEELKTFLIYLVFMTSTRFLYAAFNSKIDFTTLHWTKLNANITDFCFGVMHPYYNYLLLFGSVTLSNLASMPIYKYNTTSHIWYLIFLQASESTGPILLKKEVHRVH